MGIRKVQLGIDGISVGAKLERTDSALHEQLSTCWRTTSGPVYYTSGDPIVSAGLPGITVGADAWQMDPSWLHAK